MRDHNKSSKKQEVSRSEFRAAQMGASKFSDLDNNLFQRKEKGPAIDVEFVDGKIRLIYRGGS